MAEKFAQPGDGPQLHRHTQLPGYGAVQTLFFLRRELTFAVALNQPDDPGAQKIRVGFGILKAPQRGHTRCLTPAQYEICPATGAYQQFAASVLVEENDCPPDA